MREKYLGTAISIFVHACVILFLVAVAFAVQNRPVKVMEIDFSLVKDTAKGSPQKVEEGIIEKKTRILKGEVETKRRVDPDLPARQNPEPVPAIEPVEPPPVPTIVTASDAQGEKVIHGTPATYAGSSGSVISLQAPGDSARGTEDTNGGNMEAGKVGEIMFAEGKDFNYIRDAVMKNIEYPARARQMGLEGKTLISFIVLEKGQTSQIKIVESSGYRLLDESAKEGIARTVLSRKVPYRVTVRLPIRYKLQTAKDDRI